MASRTSKSRTSPSAGKSSSKGAAKSTVSGSRKGPPAVDKNPAVREGKSRSGPRGFLPIQHAARPMSTAKRHARQSPERQPSHPIRLPPAAP